MLRFWRVSLGRREGNDCLSLKLNKENDVRCSLLFLSFPHFLCSAAIARALFCCSPSLPPMRLNVKIEGKRQKQHVVKNGRRRGEWMDES